MIWGCIGTDILAGCCGMLLLCSTAAGIAACWLAGIASRLLLLGDCIFINSANGSLAGTAGALGV